ncbi:putative M18 family aminopeptidase [Desulfamplus magnetovallimortis]|uniref:M18 family aminopeptidase n=1 Tax=Desulfamplus magnetovallimortis TaxID=1246637 RepID=A0A1W1HCE4_9BACT|nr:M18 family aminopeptidase [Desulfamplus magnetovallimortis]SLM30164.1 putative M18 family aminopeptidase [Desulfamplus magnetovallimortis]
MNLEKYNEDLFRFLNSSPTSFHAVFNMAKFLSAKGFVRLNEGKPWKIKKDSRYYVVRNDGGIIAFYTGENQPWETGMRLCGAHTDSPALKVKPFPETDASGITSLGVEVYGGALLNSWFDRGLNLAGRITALCLDSDHKDVLSTYLVNFNKPLAVIPSLPIHLDRDANNKRHLNPQVDMRPVVYINSTGSKIVNRMAGSLEFDLQKRGGNINQSVVESSLPDLKDSELSHAGKHSEISSVAALPDRNCGNDFSMEQGEPSASDGSFIEFQGSVYRERTIAPCKPFKRLLLEQAIMENPNSHIKEVLGFDMFFTDVQEPFYTGFRQEMISAPRLDNLLSCHAGLKSIVRAQGPALSILFCADHEEVGSETLGGARGSFLNSVLSRLIPDSEKRFMASAKSFMISLDNAHAHHPAHGERYDSLHPVQLNQGPVLKTNASMRYASDSESSAFFKHLCNRAGIAYQTFVMRSDMPCGSTIGPAVSSSTGIRTVDVGAPTLGMHAIREITGTEDPFMLFLMLNELFSMADQPLLSLT